MRRDLSIVMMINLSSWYEIIKLRSGHLSTKEVKIKKIRF